jgi:hypothetical protein
VCSTLLDEAVRIAYRQRAAAAFSPGGHQWRLVRLFVTLVFQVKLLLAPERPKRQLVRCGPVAAVEIRERLKQSQSLQITALKLQEIF